MALKKETGYRNEGYSSRRDAGTGICDEPDT